MQSTERRDTICAVATAHGRAGIGIVRLSGPDAIALSQNLAGGRSLPSRTPVLRTLFDAGNQAIDTALVLIFPAPRSYTGEDVVEIHAHGNPIILDQIQLRLLGLGARLARPGEFTERAFLEGRLDLAQAEAVADLIDAGSRAAVRAAQRSLQGEFSQRVRTLAEHLEAVRIHVEAAIDFADEALDSLSDQALGHRLATLLQHHADLIDATRRGSRLRDGRVLAIIGRPNAGKSSLLNRLAGQARAIVTELPGTTRDVLREQIDLDDASMILIDTAGLRDSDDPIEAEGVRRARAELQRADHALLVIDAADHPADTIDALRQECPPGLPRTVLYNKIDLIGLPSRSEHVDGETRLWLSAHTGDGVPALQAHLRSIALAGAGEEGAFSARRRHVDTLQRVGEHLVQARQQLAEQAGELAAEELRLAQQTLAELTGGYVPDDLLGAIFQRFCIGK